MTTTSATIATLIVAISIGMALVHAAFDRVWRERLQEPPPWRARVIIMIPWVVTLVALAIASAL